ncbi:MAG: DUF4235 domain-containing protein [Pseudonocardia sp.]|jgi:hypothetical protein
MGLLFKPLTMLASVLGGILAGALFARVWRAVTGEDVAPPADSTDHSTRDVILGAVLQGAIFAGVKAAVNRFSAKSLKRFTDQQERGARAVRAG